MENDFYEGNLNHGGQMVLVKDLDDDKEIQKNNRKKRMGRIAAAAALLIAAVIIVLAIRSFMYRHTYRSFRVVNETELSAMTNVSYADCDGGVIRYGYNGAEYIDRNSKTVWNAAYEMENPVVASKGSYTVIYDKGGYSFTICGSQGALSDNTTERKIVGADISASGVVCIGTDDETSDYVNFYEKDGNKLDIEIKTVLSGDGYPLDMAVSPNGQLLMMSYLYLNEGIMQNKVVFYNFSELGQNYSDRLVGVFNDLGESIVPEVRMLSESYACAFAEDRVNFYSLQNPIKPDMIASHEYIEEIKSVFSSDEYVGIISRGDSGEAGDKLDIYTISGKLIANASISFEYEDVKIYKDLIILNNSEHCSVYTVDGSIKYSGKLGDRIDYVAGINAGRLIMFGKEKIAEVKLKY